MNPRSERLDKWLWHARFFKTRSLANAKVAAGRVRVNGRKVYKPATQITPGDVLVFSTAEGLRVVEVHALAGRRGPASEAQQLYGLRD